MPYFSRSGSLTSFPEVAREVGLDPWSLLHEFGLPRGCLDEPDSMVPSDSVCRLLEASATRSGTEGFGLRMAEVRKLSSLGPLGMLAREQRTLRDAVNALAHYARLINESLHISIEESGDVAILREELLVGEAVPVRQATELAVALLFKAMCGYLGPDWKPRRVCFVHDPPLDTSAHARLLGREVYFGAEFNGIVCARRDLAVANPNADPTLARYAMQLLDHRRPADRDRFGPRVRQLIVLQLSTGQCTVERIAQMLRVDRRTIHRRLLNEGETFSGIVDAVRRELADRYLADGQRSLARISSLLGFSAPSGFSRWYRRQFGRPASGALRARAGPVTENAQEMHGSTMAKATPSVLIVPGLRDHVPDHWQTHLQQELERHGTPVACVPRRPNEKLSCELWIEAIDGALAELAGPVVLVAHSGGVMMVVHWAQRHGRSIHGALLATPADLEHPLPPGYPSRDDLQRHGWLPIPRLPLPFRSIVAASSNDPLARHDRIVQFATAWRSELEELGEVGHLNPASGFGPWPRAVELVTSLY
jgi:predicted alpha/beta hydrolase family esterase/AraC-like DNA-binding protein